ncbi:CRISPR-associated helicase Cas3 [hydrothermal vent metagenome]|uniref:CRISPR-associated helicase Cas3 n=1 Tax=hydrothermal vent metagenome TaxID=652676 RepID=A0A3B0VGA7_9ZZZZ
MKIFKRRLTARIEHSLVTDRVTALMGPRQAGKTTLVRHLLRSEKELRYYNLKDPAVRQVLKENGRREFKHFRDATIILDEVQTLPSLLELIQLQVDEYPGKQGQFFLLGSNHLLLNRHIKESLAGRVALFTLLPLSFGELLEREGHTLLEQLLNADDRRECASILAEFYLPARESGYCKDIFREFNLFGGYPEFVRRKDPQDRKDWLSSYHQTYLETDLRQLVDLRNPESFDMFEKMFVQRVGNLMNISELARDCGLSADTIRRFIGYYRQLFIAWQAKPYHTNLGKRMMKMSKYYFYDTGLLRSVLGDFSTMSGRFFENTVLTEVNKILGFNGGRRELYFSRTATGVEADGFLTSYNGKIPLFLEVKQAEKMRRQDIKHLKKYVTEAESGIGLLINNGSALEQADDRIWVVPASWLFY